MATASGPARVVLADHQAVWRAGVRALLDPEPDLTVVGEAGRAGDVLSLVGRLGPDLLLLDAAIPADGGAAGLRLCREVRARHAACRVVLVGPPDDGRLVLAAAAVGVAGLLGRDCAAPRLLAALRSVAAGRSAFDRACAAVITGRSGMAGAGLTERQVAVLRLLARGMSNREIAGALALAEGTVKFHLAKTMRILDVTSRSAAVYEASRHGLI